MYAAPTLATRPTAATAATIAKARRTGPRVTSRTPHAASSTRLTAEASGNRAPESSAVSDASPPLLPDPTHGLALATAARPAVTSPSRTTGPKVRRRWSVSGSSGMTTRCEQHVVVEAGVRAGVAGGTGLVDGEQHRVAVAVEPDLDHALSVAGGRSLDSVLL